jgi:acetoin utilization protein AcuB
VWEMHYLISKIKIKDIMTKKVFTISRDTPIEEAARIMADKSLGGLPVTDGKKVVGMITETDLFKVFLELMGARDKGIRVTVSVESKPGQLARITKAIANAGGNFVSFGFFAGEDAASKIVTFKVEGVKKEEIKKILGSTVKKFWDIRES